MLFGVVGVVLLMCCDVCLCVTAAAVDVLLVWFGLFVNCLWV